MVARLQAQQAEQEARKEAARLETEKQEATRQLEDIARHVRELAEGKAKKKQEPRRPPLAACTENIPNTPASASAAW